jgi:hypothetical protein
LGAVRRTCSIDVTRPDGVLGPLMLDGRGRDEVDGAEVAYATMHATIDFTRGRTIGELNVDPDPRGLAAAVLGQPASLRLRDLLDPTDTSLANLLLDDIGGAVLISGYALTLSNATEAFRGSGGSTADGTPRTFKLPLNVCAGWEDGSEMPTAMLAGEPVLRIGRAAPRFDDDLPALAPGGMRRRRELAADIVDDAVHVTSWFRDTYITDEGAETLVHEYDLSAIVDLASRVVTASSAKPGQLPATDCPKAAGSAGRLVGRSLPELRAYVREELVGITTCTHLNDALRALGDLEALLNLPS